MELRQGLLRAIRAYLTKRHEIQGSLHSAETHHLAEDCAQEAILIIQAKLDGFRGESQSWAFSVAVRVALGELRRRRWRQATIERAQLGQALPAWPIDELGPERSLQQREAWALLARLIDTELGRPAPKMTAQQARQHPDMAGRVVQCSAARRRHGTGTDWRRAGGDFLQRLHAVGGEARRDDVDIAPLHERYSNGSFLLL